MKQKFVMGSKILLGLFIFLLIIFLCYLMAENPKEVEWLGFVTIPFLIVTVLTSISFVVMFVCEIIELIKQRNRKAFIEFFLTLIVSTIIFYTINIFENTNASFTGCLLSAFFIAFFVRILNYWKRYN